MKTALLVMDMQKGFMNKYTLPLIPKIKKLIAEEIFDYVIFTRFVNTPASPYVRLIGFKGMLTEQDTALVPKLEENASFIFQKHTYTPFTSQLNRFLQEKKITRIYFAGVDTNACVLKGAVDAFEKGYIPLVLAEYCASHSGEQFHALALENLKRLIGVKQVIIKKQ
ncbi:MAG: isochorismatase family cysteine hydrolase [Nanoarchaeota archaeon]